MIETFNEAVAALMVGGVMIYPLFALTVIAVAICLDKALVYGARTRLPSALVDVVETYGFEWEDLNRELGAMSGRNYARRFLDVIVQHRAQPAWWVESRAADEASQIEQALGRWLWVLETIV
ncbi:MAG: MotA/TolQ/ExbB proton channel family protein, partial [Alphaproteobacteria bacterium]|nr:MotA/TolQ/ExbB proton channel family protein [Alphaproteobacteria bacterium]